MEFILVRPAKKNGGDRYEHGKDGNEDFMVIYIPQFISRKEGGQPKQSIKVTFE